ncbi:MAG: addiction module protein [Gemmatimonas sp.]|nr:addiction module protein [Gemmatimonas sp.]
MTSCHADSPPPPSLHRRWLDLVSFINDILGALLVNYDVRFYVTEGGRDVFRDWISGVRDILGKTAIARRINRLRNGLFGDHAPCRGGVWELRIDHGPGYRVYYSKIGRDVVLVLGGGDKHSQSADITRACEFLRQELRRMNDAE